MLERFGLVLLLAFTIAAGSACSRAGVEAPNRPLEVQVSAHSGAAGPGPSRSTARLDATLQRVGASELSVDATFTNLGPATLMLSDNALDLTLASPQGVAGSARFNFDGIKRFSIPAPTVMNRLGKGASISKHFNVNVSKLAAFSQVETVTVSSETGLLVSVPWSSVPRTR